MSDLALAAAAAVAGVVIAGPALNHAITWWIGWRVVLPPLLGGVPPSGQLGRPRARCPRCGIRLAPGGLPARPSAALGGRCPVCRTPLPPWLAAVEGATGALFALAAAVVGPGWPLVGVLALVAGLVAVSAVDLAVMRIPTRFVYVTGVAVAAALALAAGATGEPGRLVGGLVGAAVLGGLLLVVYMVSSRLLGFGDVRLAVVIGLAAGWFGWQGDTPALGAVQAALNAGLVAGLAGTVAGLALLARRRRSRSFPFGPALAMGGLVVVLALA
jgi:leader peptidase (prepilin peptidase) / N-methyltransferase